MIDLTLSSEDEAPPKRPRVSPQHLQKKPLQAEAPQVKSIPNAAAPGGPTFPAAQPLPSVILRGDSGLGVLERQAVGAPPPAGPPAPFTALPGSFHGLGRAAGASGAHAADGDDEASDQEEPGAFGGAGTGWRDAAAATRNAQPANGGGILLDDDLGEGDEAGGDVRAGSFQDRGARLGSGGGLEARVEDANADAEEAAGGSSPDGGGLGGPKRKRGGGGKRLTAEEREERDRLKKAAREAEKAEKQRERERKAAEREEAKKTKLGKKEADRQQKEANNALKPTMVGRHMRVLLSNTLAMSPLGATMRELIPRVRNGQKDQTFPAEVHRNMPLAARGYRYCMWGVRLPAAAAARVQAAEGCALQPCDLEDPDGAGLPLLLFPALVMLLSGDELLTRLLAASGPAAPLAGLYGDVARAHPGATLLVYVTGLEEAIKRRERANKGFNRAAVEDMLFDVAVGMPAVRLQYDCPDNDWERAGTDILNFGYSLSQQPRKRMDAYLEHFGSRSTLPLRTIKEVLREQGGPEQEALCDALSALVAPQRAAAVAAEFPSLAAIMEALRSRPEGPARDLMMARCRIPGVVPGKHRQLVAGPVASTNVARFLTRQDGRENWQEVVE